MAPNPRTSEVPEPAATYAAATEADCFKVCLVAPRDGFLATDVLWTTNNYYIAFIRFIITANVCVYMFRHLLRSG